MRSCTAYIVFLQIHQVKKDSQIIPFDLTFLNSFPAMPGLEMNNVFNGVCGGTGSVAPVVAVSRTNTVVSSSAWSVLTQTLCVT